MAADPERKSAFGIPLLVGAVGFGLVAALLSYVYLKSEARALIENVSETDAER